MTQPPTGLHVGPRNGAATADAVVVGGGTVGGWCAYFLRRSGLDRVIVVEQGTLGCGASSRAAGIVRTQGGTEWAVRLGEWSRRFYLSQQDELGIDSGFVPQGYLLPCFSQADVAAARNRIAKQNAAGISVRWLAPAELEELNPTFAKGVAIGGAFCADDGYLNPPRNVAAYAVALAAAAVEIREHVSFTGLAMSAGRVNGVQTSAGTISTPVIVLTGGPQLAQVGRLGGIRIPVGGVRHQVAVTQPHPDFGPGRLPMVFDLTNGLYWRAEEGGLLFGMSNPRERPGEATTIDEAYLDRMRRRLADLVPVTAGLGLRKVWAATIDYTPDHLPIIGPALTPEGPLPSVTIASAGGHGMMWGPAVARAAADVALNGTSEVADVSQLGLDRFDDTGHSKLAADPIALPFPEGAP